MSINLRVNRKCTCQTPNAKFHIRLLLGITTAFANSLRCFSYKVTDAAADNLFKICIVAIPKRHEECVYIVGGVTYAHCNRRINESCRRFGFPKLNYCNCIAMNAIHMSIFLSAALCRATMREFIRLTNSSHVCLRPTTTLFFVTIFFFLLQSTQMACMKTK